MLHGNFGKKLNRYSGLTRHQEWLDKLDQIVNRSKEHFVQHYKQKYNLPFPIWISVEVWDFGLLSTSYNGLNVSDKSVIAQKYKIPNGRKIKNWQVMESWLRTINYICGIRILLINLNCQRKAACEILNISEG